MTFDRYADTVAKLRPIIRRLDEQSAGGEKASAREERWRAALAPFLSPAEAAATIHCVESCHPDPDPKAAARDAGALLPEWRRRQKSLQPADLPELEKLNFNPGSFELLPVGSWRIRFQFTLASDFYSRDEAGLFPIDNPLRRDRALQWPTLASTTWKGMLRNTWLTLYQDRHRESELRVFGTDKPGEGLPENEDHVRGCIHPHSTSFRKVSFAVINPHEREKKIGMPVFYEVVPKDASGVFCLDYVPRLGASTFAQSAADLAAIAPVLAVLFQDLRLGAKTTIGFGQLQDRIAGECILLAHGVPEKAAEPAAPPSPDLPRYLEAPFVLIQRFRNPEGALNPNFVPVGKGESQLFEKAKKWWEREGRKAWEERQPGARAPELQAPPPPQQLHRPVRSRAVQLSALTTLEKTLIGFAASLDGSAK